jgi:hypothetical protein
MTDSRYFRLVVRVSETLLQELVAHLDGGGSEEDAVAAEVTRTGVVVEEIGASD